MSRVPLKQDSRISLESGSAGKILEICRLGGTCGVYMSHKNRGDLILVPFKRVMFGKCGNPADVYMGVSVLEGALVGFMQRQTNRKLTPLRHGRNCQGGSVLLAPWSKHPFRLQMVTYPVTDFTLAQTKMEASTKPL